MKNPAAPRVMRDFLFCHPTAKRHYDLPLRQVQNILIPLPILVHGPARRKPVIDGVMVCYRAVTCCSWFFLYCGLVV